MVSKILKIKHLKIVITWCSRSVFFVAFIAGILGTLPICIPHTSARTCRVNRNIAARVASELFDKTHGGECPIVNSVEGTHACLGAWTGTWTPASRWFVRFFITVTTCVQRQGKLHFILVYVYVLPIHIFVYFCVTNKRPTNMTGLFTYYPNSMKLTIYLKTRNQHPLPPNK